VIKAPPIGRLTAKEIEKWLEARLKATTQGNWTGGAGDFGQALVSIAARFAEIIIERLNRAPDKNLLAYLDMLGASLAPPQPAQVALVFTPVPGCPVATIVPEGTQVAAAGREGGPPVAFETQRPLTLTTAGIAGMFVRRPGPDEPDQLLDDRGRAEKHDKYIDLVSSEHPAWRDVDHSLYIGLKDVLGRSGLASLNLAFDVASVVGPDPRKLVWSLVHADGETTIDDASSSGMAGTRNLPSFEDGTASLAKSGDITFTNVPAISTYRINQTESRWLRARLTTPIARRSEKVSGLIRAEHLPALTLKFINATFSSVSLLTAAFSNTTPLDTTKDFLPFGDRPKLGDTFYFCAGELFGTPGAKVTLTYNLSETQAPFGGTGAKLAWEYWDGCRWQGALSGAGKDAIYTDTTGALSDKSGRGGGQCEFWLGNKVASTAINGIKGYWLRVRLRGGDYGKEASYKESSKSPSGYQYIPPSFRPPSIASITAKAEITETELKPDHIFACNDFEFAAPDELPFHPFSPTSDLTTTLYIGLRPADDGPVFPNLPVAIQFEVEELPIPRLGVKSSHTEANRLVWECWDGGQKKWRSPTLRDDTAGLNRSGILEFLAPPWFTRRSELGVDCFWLRGRWMEDAAVPEPRLKLVLLNAVTAEQSVTIRDEVLGSSDGTPNQRFTTANRPILPGTLDLRVREPDHPPKAERDEIEALLAPGSIVVTQGESNASGVWVRWIQVKDFYASGPRDRHFVLDYMSGSIIFGDGAFGMVPPQGAGNVRLIAYRTGGGAAGNCAAGTIAQLKTTVPYVAAVTNPWPARGGFDLETIERLRERAPKSIRHGDRAVTLEDFEDLAFEASPEIARAKCVPVADLSSGGKAAELDAQGHKSEPGYRPGSVSVIVVPHGTEAMPLPNLVLRDRVQAYLDERRLPVIDLHVVGPEYLVFDVEMEIVLTSLDMAPSMHARIEHTIRRFLHPLSGGFDGSGWDFGRMPYRSDLIRLISEVQGVDHVGSAEIKEAKAESGKEQTLARGRSLALVGAGTVSIRIAGVPQDNRR